MMRSLPFAACYVYSPLGSDSLSQRSRLLRSLLKSRDLQFLSIYAERVRNEVLAKPCLAEFFATAPVLVPVPGSSPRRGGRGSVTELLAGALLAHGLGSAVWPGLRRVLAVPKSATCPACKRPTAAVHYKSFAVESGAAAPTAMLLVDDVVTKGRTLLAAATRLQDAFPTARIRAFALLRTMGMIAGVDQLIDPCVGQIRWRAGDAHRSP
jgi:predicted amidophosphoribosyltransferase